MILGIGVDIVELDRIEKIIERQPKFVDRILTEEEKKKFNKLQGKRKIEYLGGRFAAKEAFVKAIGTGISASYSWHDINIKSESNGKPVLCVEKVKETIHLSISHSKKYAIAQVIIESLAS